MDTHHNKGDQYVATLKQFLTLGMGFNPKQGVIRNLRVYMVAPLFGRGSEKATEKIVAKYFFSSEHEFVMKNLVRKGGYFYFESDKHFERFFRELKKIGWQSQEQVNKAYIPSIVVDSIYYSMEDYQALCSNPACLRPAERWEIADYGKSCPRCHSELHEINSKKAIKNAEAKAKQAA